MSAENSQVQNQVASLRLEAYWKDFRKKLGELHKRLGQEQSTVVHKDASYNQYLKQALVLSTQGLALIPEKNKDEIKKLHEQLMAEKANLFLIFNVNSSCTLALANFFVEQFTLFQKIEEPANSLLQDHVSAAKNEATTYAGILEEQLKEYDQQLTLKRQKKQDQESISRVRASISRSRASKTGTATPGHDSPVSQISGFSGHSFKSQGGSKAGSLVGSPRGADLHSDQRDVEELEGAVNILSAEEMKLDREVRTARALQLQWHEPLQKALKLFLEEYFKLFAMGKPIEANSLLFVLAPEQFMDPNHLAVIFQQPLQDKIQELQNKFNHLQEERFKLSQEISQQQAAVAELLAKKNQLSLALGFAQAHEPDCLAFAVPNKTESLQELSNKQKAAVKEFNKTLEDELLALDVQIHQKGIDVGKLSEKTAVLSAQINKLAAELPVLEGIKEVFNNLRKHDLFSLTFSQDLKNEKVGKIYLECLNTMISSVADFMVRLQKLRSCRDKGTIEIVERFNKLMSGGLQEMLGTQYTKLAPALRNYQVYWSEKRSNLSAQSQQSPGLLPQFEQIKPGGSPSSAGGQAGSIPPLRIDSSLVQVDSARSSPSRGSRTTP